MVHPFATARIFFNRLIVRREAIALLPALLLGGVALGGEIVLICAAIIFPAGFAIFAAGRAHAKTHAHDGLTGLPLRSAVIDALDMAFTKAPRTGKTTIAFAVALDDFDGLEERYGLAVSEEVLRRTGERIAMALRGTDILARIDKSTFAAAFGPIPRADLETGLQVASRLQEAVHAPIALDAGNIYVTCSIGFCLGTRAPQPAGEAILGAAQDALAEAQASSLGAVRSYSANMCRVPQGAEETTEVLDALENGQIRPWFQPQVCTSTGTVSGFEALARWEHPTRGVIGPDQFLPAIAAAGKTERLGEVILFHSFTALKSWDRAGLPIPTIGVNFAPEELRNPRLADKIAWELDRFDLSPDRLTIEVLETVVADARDESVSRSISQLADMGCHIDLDDFGTGQASLAALRQFKIARIKIDRSFVTNIDEDRDQQKMLAAILGLAEQLELATLAEGVERVGEHSMLSQLGCEHVQGFGIARPMPFEDTIAWIKRHSEKLAEPHDLTRRAV